ncbi:TetR family transcriptional regulator [Streptomyces sp. 16-176A]|uniref:TetR family transcriptional regulator n=1 Tax=Streptomyces sp. 16-176A TaxID=2530458 RepID=UPI00345D4D52
MKQVRAVRTRSTILQAAAEAFDRHGYAGTALACVTREAGTSMGALTFHFPTKPDLADAVQASGAGITRDVVARVAALPVSSVSRARALALALARLLAECTVVRATARLTRERAMPELWTGVWFGCLVEQLREAHAEGRLRGEVTPETFAEAVQFLLTGIEECTRCAPAEAHADATAVRRIARAWDLLMYGAACPPEHVGR